MLMQVRYFGVCVFKLYYNTNSLQRTAGCHKMRSEDHLHPLEGYLGGVNTKHDRLCSYLKLENCNALKSSDASSFNLADNYLQQNPKACWEDIVAIFCKLAHYTLAYTVSEEYGVDYNSIQECSKE